MKKTLLLALVLAATLTSCYRTSRETWEDSKTCGRYVGKGLRALIFGQHADQKDYAYLNNWQKEPEYIPLADSEYKSMEMAEYVAPQAKESPGDPGSLLPGVEAFINPAGYLAGLFSNVHFDTDNYSVKGDDNSHMLHEVAKYLIKSPRTYIFIEGHADERGAAAYNLALGSRRANAVRTYLIQNGVNPDQLFTISYGKERPLVNGHDAPTWQKNRRAQFKLYDR